MVSGDPTIYKSRGRSSTRDIHDVPRCVSICCVFIGFWFIVAIMPDLDFFSLVTPFVTIGLAVLCVALRFYTRIKLKGGIAFDDWTILFGLIVLLVFYGIWIWGELVASQEPPSHLTANSSTKFSRPLYRSRQGEGRKSLAGKSRCISIRDVSEASLRPANFVLYRYHHRQNLDITSLSPPLLNAPVLSRTNTRGGYNRCLLLRRFLDRHSFQLHSSRIQLD